MTVERARDAIASNDLDELIRVVDALAGDHAWDALLDVRDLARRAFEATGRQMWPAASWAEYRLALRGPAEVLAEVLTPDAGFFAPGPLAEVAAQHHHWNDCGDLIPDGPMRQLFAFECVARGEGIEQPPPVDLFDVPLVRERWEPDYISAHYTTQGIELQAPELPRGRAVELHSPCEPLGDDESFAGVDALVDVVRHWASDDGATIAVAAVDGDAFDAVSTLASTSTSTTPTGLIRVAALSGTEAMEWMAWAAADGAGGRRHGAAAGRAAAWRAAHALAGFDPDDAFEPDELGEAVATLRWSWWGPSDASLGTAFRLAVDDPDDGVAFAIEAVVRSDR